MSHRHREDRRNFTGGLNTRDNKSMLHESESPDMRNVLLGKRGGFAPRPGTEAALNKPVSKKQQEDGSYYPVTSIHGFTKEGGARHILAFSCDELKRAGAQDWHLIRDGFTKNTYLEFTYHPYEDKMLFVNGADGYWETDGFEAEKTSFYPPETYGDPGDPDYIDEAVEIGSSSIPERPKYIAWYDNRVWLANVQGYPDRIYFNVDDINGNTMYNYFTPWSWMRASNIRGEPITAIKPFGRSLFVFTNTSIKVIIPAEPYIHEDQVYIPPTYQMHDLSTVVGAVSQRAVQEVVGRLVFLAINGVYMMDAESAPFKISGNIEPTIDEIDDDNRGRACGGFWDNKYFLSVPEKQGGE